MLKNASREVKILSQAPALKENIEGLSTVKSLPGQLLLRVELNGSFACINWFHTQPSDYTDVSLILLYFVLDFRSSTCLSLQLFS